MDGVRQEVGFVSGLNIPNLVLKEKKFNVFGHNRSNMTEIELYNELQNVEGCLKMADSQISELRKKKNDIMNDFLSLLPFQKCDKVLTLTTLTRCLSSIQMEGRILGFLLLVMCLHKTGRCCR